VCIGKRQRGTLLLFSSLRLKKEGKAIEKMCPNRSYRPGSRGSGYPLQVRTRKASLAGFPLLSFTQNNQGGCLHLNSPPILGEPVPRFWAGSCPGGGKGCSAACTHRHKTNHPHNSKIPLSIACDGEG